MTEKGTRIFTQDGYVALNRGYMAVKPNQNPVKGGYAPTVGQGPGTPPQTVKNQPTSVQPPKK